MCFVYLNQCFVGNLLPTKRKIIPMDALKNKNWGLRWWQLNKLLGPGGGRSRAWLCRAVLGEAGRLMLMQIRTLGTYWTAGPCYLACGWWVLNSLNWICPGAHLRKTKQASTLRPVLIQDLCLSFRRENADCYWCYHPACGTVILWGDSSTQP